LYIKPTVNCADIIFPGKKFYILNYLGSRSTKVAV